MIDNFKIECRNATDKVIECLLKTITLDKYESKMGVEYNNKDTKNFTGGMYIQITSCKKIVVSGSLHKYKNYLLNGNLYNYDSFTMNEAKETINTLFDKLQLNMNDFVITHYEVGISMKIDFDAKEFIYNIHSIGNTQTECKKFYLSPLVKDERMKLTNAHRDFKKVYKVYDKVNELKDKRQLKETLGDILRIETIYRRQENKNLIDFFTASNLEKVQNYFFNDWGRLKFDYDIKAPKGTHKLKIDIAKDLFSNGSVYVLNKIKEEYTSDTISKRIYYGLVDFIKGWNEAKHNYLIVEKKIVTKFRKLYLIENQYYKDNFNFY